MSPGNRAGRPRACSREVLAEAACELFLEQGYHATSVSDITTRAGVSRSSFFNYFGTKSDVLWGALDERITALAQRLHDEPMSALDSGLRAAVSEAGHDFRPDSLALAFANVGAMGIADAIEREAGVRRSRIAAAVSGRLRRDGVDPLRAEVVAAAYGGAVLAAIQRWSWLGPGRTSLAALLMEALDAVPRVVTARDRGSRAGDDDRRLGNRRGAQSDDVGLVGGAGLRRAASQRTPGSPSSRLRAPDAIEVTVSEESD